MSATLTDSHASVFLTERDLQLLAERKRLRSYEKLGTHFAELDGTKGIHSAVSAPNAIPQREDKPK